MTSCSSCSPQQVDSVAGADALLSEAVAQVIEREDRAAHPDRLTTRHGCRNVGELVQRATRVSGRTASDVIAAAKAVGRRVATSTGELLPAEFPRLRDALGAAEVGIDGVVGVAAAFRGCLAGRAALLAADEELAAAARGEGVDAAPPASADELRALAHGVGGISGPGRCRASGIASAAQDEE